MVRTIELFKFTLLAALAAGLTPANGQDAPTNCAGGKPVEARIRACSSIIDAKPLPSNPKAEAYRIRAAAYSEKANRLSKQSRRHRARRWGQHYSRIDARETSCPSCPRCARRTAELDAGAPTRLADHTFCILRPSRGIAGDRCGGALRHPRGWRSARIAQVSADCSHIGAHLAGASVHAFIFKDGVVHRMLPW